MYDVAVKQLIGLRQFRSLLLILYNHIKPICAIITRTETQLVTQGSPGRQLGVSDIEVCNRTRSHNYSAIIWANRSDNWV